MKDLTHSKPSHESLSNADLFYQNVMIIVWWRFFMFKNFLEYSNIYGNTLGFY